MQAQCCTRRERQRNATVIGKQSGLGVAETAAATPLDPDDRALKFKCNSRNGSNSP